MKIKLIQPAMLPRPMDTKLKTRMSPSLGLLTLANLTPEEHEVIIENENVEVIDFNEPVDLVAITVTVDVMNRAAEISKEFQKRGIMINASFVFGLDEDDAAIFKNTLDWIVKNKIETVTSHIMTPYPGTKLYSSLLKENRITDYNLSKYNTSHVVYKPKNMTPEELYNGYLWIYKEVYTFKNIMRRLPKSKKQWLPFLAFNFLYRKFGKITELLCSIVSFETIGRVSRWVAYRT